jgi:hypothetical protein
MGEESVAALLLAAAQRDRQAFQALVAVPDMSRDVRVEGNELLSVIETAKA